MELGQADDVWLEILPHWEAKCPLEYWMNPTLKQVREALEEIALRPYKDSDLESLLASNRARAEEAIATLDEMPNPYLPSRDDFKGYLEGGHENEHAVTVALIAYDWLVEHMESK